MYGVDQVPRWADFDISAVTQTPLEYRFNGDTCWSGFVAETLSEEDTDAAAILRATANLPWSPWMDHPDNCIASYPPRTGTNWLQTEVEWRAFIKGAKASDVEIDIGFYRRPYGNGAFALLSTSTYLVQLDSEGNGLIQGSVPNSYGYETIIQTCGKSAT
jgi:hypothetical protein